MNTLYFISGVSTENFVKLLSKLNLDFISERNSVAIKVHFGEENNTTYIPAEFYSPLVDILKQKNALPFFTDTNTIYVGKRSNAIEHLILSYHHGFGKNSHQAPVIIADGLKGDDFVEVEINLKYFTTAKIASYIYHSDTLICISHFKGHMMFGFAGAIKNLGMGCAPRSAKYQLHNSLKPKVKITNCTGCKICIGHCPSGALSLNDKHIILDTTKCIGCGECIHRCKYKVFSIPWDGSYKEVQEKTVEYAYAVMKCKKGNCVFINVLDNITKDCDCMKTQPPELKNIGILAGYDPVSIDYASLNIVNSLSKEYRISSDLFKKFWPEIDYNVQLDYAEKIRLGDKNYTLINI